MVLDKRKICGTIYYVPCAGIAHPVERHLAKVEVASSSLVARSKKDSFLLKAVFFYLFTLYLKSSGFNIKISKSQTWRFYLYVLFIEAFVADDICADKRGYRHGKNDADTAGYAAYDLNGKI